MSTTSNIEIKLISSQETIAVRHPVLREGRPLAECVFEHDALPTTKHLGLYLDEHLVGVATLIESKNQLFQEQHQFQLRGMAVLKDFQSCGYGDLLLQYAEQLVFKHKESLIWFNARTVAVGFYKKNNYKIIGEPFEISGVGTHHKMYKTL